jgi:hypothetical protein
MVAGVNSRTRTAAVATDLLQVLSETVRMLQGDPTHLPRSGNAALCFGSLTRLCMVDNAGIITTAYPVAESIFLPRFRERIGSVPHLQHHALHPTVMSHPPLQRPDNPAVANLDASPTTHADAATTSVGQIVPADVEHEIAAVRSVSECVTPAIAQSGAASPAIPALGMEVAGGSRQDVHSAPVSGRQTPLREVLHTMGESIVDAERGTIVEEPASVMSRTSSAISLISAPPALGIFGSSGAAPQDVDTRGLATGHGSAVFTEGMMRGRLSSDGGVTRTLSVQPQTLLTATPSISPAAAQPQVVPSQPQLASLQQTQAMPTGSIPGKRVAAFHSTMFEVPHNLARVASSASTLTSSGTAAPGGAQHAQSGPPAHSGTTADNGQAAAPSSGEQTPVHGNPGAAGALGKSRMDQFRARLHVPRPPTSTPVTPAATAGRPGSDGRVRGRLMMTLTLNPGTTTPSSNSVLAAEHSVGSARSMGTTVTSIGVDSDGDGSRTALPVTAAESLDRSTPMTGVSAELSGAGDGVSLLTMLSSTGLSTARGSVVTMTDELAEGKQSMTGVILPLGHAEDGRHGSRKGGSVRIRNGSKGALTGSDGGAQSDSDSIGDELTEERPDVDGLERRRSKAADDLSEGSGGGDEDLDAADGNADDADDDDVDDDDDAEEYRFRYDLTGPSHPTHVQDTSFAESGEQAAVQRSAKQPLLQAVRGLQRIIGGGGARDASSLLSGGSASGAGLAGGALGTNGSASAPVGPSGDGLGTEVSSHLEMAPLSARTTAAGLVSGPSEVDGAARRVVAHDADQHRPENGLVLRAILREFGLVIEHPHWRDHQKMLKSLGIAILVTGVCVCV